MFAQCDEDGDGGLNLDEFKKFCGVMREKLVEARGGAYELTDE